MPSNTLFFDLGASEGQLEPITQKERVAALLSLGYDAVTIVHQASATLTDADKCSIKPLKTEELSSAVSPIDIQRHKPHGNPEKLHFLTRLNIPIDDTNIAQESCSKTSITHSYDILAVQPQSERSFGFACTTLDVDLISIDLSKRLAYRFKPDHIKTALNRGIHFEVSYASALRDQGSRRQFFANVQALTRETRGKGIVLTSRARSVIDARGPYDVINLATFLGLTEQQARNALTENAAAVVIHADKRKSYRETLQIKFSSDKNGDK